MTYKFVAVFALFAIVAAGPLDYQHDYHSAPVLVKKVADADGFKRTVEYTADEHNGFQATVHREPLQGYKAPVVPVQKYVAAAAVVPVAKYVAPVAKVAVPVAKVIAEPAYNYTIISMS